LRTTSVSGKIATKFVINLRGALFLMGKPKKQTSPRKTGLRRSHLVLKLARTVNGSSPVKVHTTRRETGKTK
jgi:ribosomal protein L32